MSKQTPLYACHMALGARMVAFHGWDMPLHYGSQLEEHLHVRRDAGVFDVSHMTVIDVSGPESRIFLRFLLTNDVDKLTHNGKALYSCMCHEQGGIIDDVMVYRQSPEQYRLVFNAATHDRVVTWIQKQVQGFHCTLHENHDLAILAVQGPRAIQKTLDVLSVNAALMASQPQRFESVECEGMLLARTGYTGEDGFEIMLPGPQAITLWEALLKADVQPCGLAARDTLRLEAGLLLSGQDMDESTTPFESGLAWTVHGMDNERDFIGKPALLEQQQQGLKRQLIGLVLQERGIMRTGNQVLLDHQPQGMVTSGSYSPTLAKSIAFARIPVQTYQTIDVLIRDITHPACVSKRCFLPSINEAS